MLAVNALDEGTIGGKRTRAEKKYFFDTVWHLFRNIDLLLSAPPNIASPGQILYTAAVEYPFPPVGIVGAADGKNRRAFFCPELESVYTDFTDETCSRSPDCPDSASGAALLRGCEVGSVAGYAA